MKKKILVLVLVLGGVVFAWQKFHKKTFRYAGTLEATEVDISPQVMGLLSNVAVKEGETVTQGQVIIEIAGEDLKLAAALAERDFKRADQLRKAGSMPEETYEKLRYKRDDALLRASWCTIKAPLSGTVLDRYHEPGEMVGVGNKILTLADLSHVWAFIYVPEKMLSRISLQQSVQGLIPDLGQEFEGKIALIRDQAEFTPKNVQTREERTRLVYGVKVVFSNPERRLKPGMTIEVKLPD